MDSIRFADGSIKSCSFLSTVPDGSTKTAYIALDDVDFAAAAAIFADQEKTKAMTYGSMRLIGYTELIMLGVQPYGIQAVLRGGHDETSQMLEEADNG